MKAALLFDKMPKCCSDCRLFVKLKMNRMEEGYCLIGDGDFEHDDYPTHIPELEYLNKNTPPWCQLVEIDIKKVEIE